MICGNTNDLHGDRASDLTKDIAMHYIALAAMMVLRRILPVGGGALAETGILICICLVLHENIESWKKPPNG